MLEVVGPISSDLVVSDALTSAVSRELIEFLEPTFVDRIIDSVLDDITSEDAVDVAESLLEGITAGLAELLRILIVATLIIGGAAVLVVWRFRKSIEEPLEA